MTRDYRPETEWRSASSRPRRSNAAAAPAYDYGYAPRELTAPSRRTRTRSRTRTRTRSVADRRFAAFLVVLLAWAGIGYASGLVRIVGLKRDIGKVEAEMAAVQRRNKELQKTVSEMESPAYVERAAREQLGLVRPDEVRFLVGKKVDPANADHRDVARRPGSGNIYE